MIVDNLNMVEEIDLTDEGKTFKGKKSYNEVEAPEQWDALQTCNPLKRKHGSVQTPSLVSFVSSNS